MILRHKAKTVRTFLLDEHFGREVLATELALLNKLWDLIKQLLSPVVILERNVAARSYEIVRGMTPARKALELT